MCDNNTNGFWKKIGTVGIKCEKKPSIPYGVELPSGDVSYKSDDVLNTWKNSFSNLLNNKGVDDVNVNVNKDDIIIHDAMLDADITREEVVKALIKAKTGKATGIDDIPVEILFNENCILFMCELFNKCYPKGTTTNLMNPCL